MFMTYVNFPKMSFRTCWCVLWMFIAGFSGTSLFSQSIAVADQTFKVEGVHEFAYAFAEGDEVDLFVQLIAGRRLKTVEILLVPDQSVFRSYELDTVLQKTIHIAQTGLYLLRVTETGMGKKICRFTLHRRTNNIVNKRLDTRIAWDWKNLPQYQIARRQIQVGKKTEVVPLGGQVTVNGSKFGFKKTTNYYQFTLPPNTVRWAYRISVGQSAIEARQKDAAKITAALKIAAAKTLGFEPQSALAIYALGLAIDMSAYSAGEDVEYALLDGPNLPLYLDGKQYDTYIYQSGITVDVQRRYSPLQGSFYFGLRNKNWIDDILVLVDIEAVTETPLYEEETFLEPVRP
jgi:hypothetical protein